MLEGWCSQAALEDRRVIIWCLAIISGNLMINVIPLYRINSFIYECVGGSWSVGFKQVVVLISFVTLGNGQEVFYGGFEHKYSIRKIIELIPCNVVDGLM